MMSLFVNLPASFCVVISTVLLHLHDDERGICRMLFQQLSQSDVSVCLKGGRVHMNSPEIVNVATMALVCHIKRLS